MKVATLAGLVLVAAHAAGFVWRAERSAGSELAIDVSHVTDWGAGPGLVRRRWIETYRGGYTREVSATQLVGPFQDPAAPAGSGRIVIGQALLDDGKASPGTIAGVMKQMSDAELRGHSPK